MTAMLATTNLGYRIGARRVVDDVSLEIRAGEWVALVGPNGAGKSTLLALLAGVLAPARGAVDCLGRRLAHWPARERARQIAWLAQAGDTEGEIAVRDVVLLGRLPHHGLFSPPLARDVALATAAMAESQVDHLSERRLSQLSGGERQRVLIARSLASEAPILLLDEPTAHLDAPHQRTLVRALRRRVDAGVAVVTVLHDLSLALLADRVIVLIDGRVAAQGPSDSPSLHDALEAAFDHAFEIRELACGEARDGDATGDGATSRRRRRIAVPLF